MSADGTTEDDPTRGFLDATVPRDEPWNGAEDDSPARPRHAHDDGAHARDVRRGGRFGYLPLAVSAGYTAAVLASDREQPDEHDDTSAFDAGDFGGAGAGL